MKRLACVVLFASACDSGSDAGPSSGAATSTSGDASATVAMTAGDAATGTPQTAGESPDDTADDADTGATDGPDTDGLANCAALLAAAPGTPDGVYPFHPAGDTTQTPFDAYCDMTTDGGGWTLVGRSAVAEEATPWMVEFGWHSASGSLDVDDAPYSLGALQARLEFSELLIGTYTRGKTWGPDLFKLDAPELFVFVYGQSPYDSTTTTLTGQCVTENGPHHLSLIGWTTDATKFRVSESQFDSQTGLLRGGFAFTHPPDDCDGGGHLGDLQGMVMVR